MGSQDGWGSGNGLPWVWAVRYHRRDSGGPGRKVVDDGNAGCRLGLYPFLHLWVGMGVPMGAG